MSARERAAETIRLGYGEGIADEVLAGFEAAGLRVIDEPEAPYDLVADGPVWIGDGFAVVALPDGGVALGTERDDTSHHLPPEVAAAISAAHIRGSDYR